MVLRLVNRYSQKTKIFISRWLGCSSMVYNWHCDRLEKLFFSSLFSVTTRPKIRQVPASLPCVRLVYELLPSIKFYRKFQVDSKGLWALAVVE